ncbi:MAG TPA: hypothetical protein VFD05_02895 [Bacilli bacterium]|nr:hypothetical protein [Bacilli bacterium]
MNIFSKTKLNAYWPVLSEAEVFKLLTIRAEKAERSDPIIITFERGKLSAKHFNFQHFFKRDYLVEVRQTLDGKTVDKPFFAIFFTKEGNFYLVKCQYQQSADGIYYKTVGGLKPEDAANIAVFLAEYDLTSLHPVTREKAYSFNQKRNIYY